MSYFNRRTALTFLAALALTGCGFTPVHAPGGAGHALRGQIAIHPANNRQDFVLTNRLQERLGHSTAGRYALLYNSDINSDALGITNEQEITRFNLLGTVTFELKDRETGDIVLSDQVSSFTAYSARASTVATLTAEEDAEDRLMIILADQMVARLLARAPDLRP